MTSTTPRAITKSDPSKVSIEWEDGVETVYRSAELRRLCPCARCIDEITGRALLNPTTVPDDLTQVDVSLVGRYAITVRFSDGHDTGIYPYPMLRERDPAAS